MRRFLLAGTALMMFGCATTPKETGPRQASSVAETALATSRSIASNEDCAEVNHPGNDEGDFSATNRLIRKQRSCAAAEFVFNRCPHGAMYSNYEGSSVLEQSASTIQICEKAIGSDEGIKKIYHSLTKKYCDFPGDSRHTVAVTDECFHDLAVSLGKLVELRKDQ